MISSAAKLEAMPKKLRPKGRRLASQGLKESQDRAAQEDVAGVEASARGMEREESLAAIQGALTRNLQLVWMEGCTHVMQCGD